MAARSSIQWDAVSIKLVFGLLSAIALVFLIAPTFIVLITSFTASQSLKFPPEHLSLRWYAALWDADQMQRAAWNSLVIAFWTTLISVVLGTAASLAIARSRSKWVRAADVLFMSPLLLPALAFGFAALIFINKLGFTPSILFLVMGHVIVCVPAHHAGGAVAARSGLARSLRKPRRQFLDDLSARHLAADLLRRRRRCLSRFHGVVR
jgi:putative spermidine/putrescine transport system permease protein